jgi:dTDP-4-dehydrorhamnose 3,5-epimerase
MPGVEGGIRFDDPSIEIEWPLSVDTISERDSLHPLIDINFKGL